jgi:hypothetical protein
VVYGHTPVARSSLHGNSAGEPRSIRGRSWSDVILPYFFLQVPLAGGVFLRIAASNVLLWFCGGPKFKAGNTDVAATFEVCTCVV